MRFGSWSAGSDAAVAARPGSTATISAPIAVSTPTEMAFPSELMQSSHWLCVDLPRSLERYHSAAKSGVTLRAHAIAKATARPP